MSPRVVLAVAGLAALALPLPAFTILGLAVTAAGVVGVWISVARPGSSAPAVVLAAATVSWLATPAGHLRPERLALLALAAVVVHSSAALAAVVPARARVPAGLLARWAGWTAGAAALGIGVVAATALPAGTLPAVPVTVGAVVALAVGVVVLRCAGRPGRNEPVSPSGRSG